MYMGKKIMIVTVRKWGNSLGILLSKAELEEIGIRENDEVELIIARKKNVLMDMAGKLHFKKPTKQLLEEARKDFSKWGL